MSTTSHAGQPQPTKPLKLLWAFYDEASRYEYSDPVRAQTMFEQISQEGLENYTAPADLWHNTSMVAARVKHRDAELKLIEQGLQEWPDNVDLLCDELQLRYSTHFNLERAQELWNKLTSLPEEQTHPFWRYWVYGAIFWATKRFNRDMALKLLDDGLRYVSGDSVAELFRNYRRVLVDSPPSQTFASEDEWVQYQQIALNLLERKYRLGIKLGLEGAYQLAMQLAELYQERTGTAIDNLVPPSYEDTAAKGEFIDFRHLLDRAMACLDLAEAMYTRDLNRPISEIYALRARILMAQRRYAEALNVLISLPDSVFSSDPSLVTMKGLAVQMTGAKLGQGPVLSQDTAHDQINNAFQLVLRNDGDPLLEAARQNPAVQRILLSVVNRLGAN